VTIADLLGQLDRTQPLPQQMQGLSPEDAQAVQFGLQLPPGDPRLQMTVRVENDIGDMDCSITVEEGPDNPTMQAEQFQTIMQLPPQILMQFPPEFIIQASALRNKDQLIKLLEQHQQSQAQAADAANANKQAMETAQVQKTQADAADKRAQAMERMHGIAVDHAAQPGADAQQAADVASSQAQTLGQMHGMAMDHAAAQQPPDPGLAPPQP
jgi:hypothetical protein